MYHMVLTARARLQGAASGSAGLGSYGTTHGGTIFTGAEEGSTVLGACSIIQGGITLCVKVPALTGGMRPDVYKMQMSVIFN